MPSNKDSKEPHRPKSTSRPGRGRRRQSSGPRTGSENNFRFEGNVDSVMRVTNQLSQMKNGSTMVRASFEFLDGSGSQKRSRDDDNDEEGTRGRSQRPRYKSPEREENKGCGNCDKPGHTARDRVKVGRSGWMDGACPKCNKPGHMYDNCPHRRPEEDIEYLFWFRQNKGLVKSQINVGRCLRRALAGSQDTRFQLNNVYAPPYSPKFARQIQRERELARTECENCGVMGHEEKSCTEKCGACGDDTHKSSRCEIRLEACLCSEHPGHIRSQCPLVCWYCQYIGQERDEHLGIDCPELCHYCLKAGHTMRDCVALPGPSRKCPVCREEKHLPIDCVSAYCPVNYCKEKLTCVDHCKKCGYESDMDGMLWGNHILTHACGKWLKVWQKNGPAGRGILLVCALDNSHPPVTADSLDDIRKEFLDIEVGTESPQYAHECQACADLVRKANEAKLKFGDGKGKAVANRDVDDMDVGEG
ncbi:uncharacterized protein F4812DRAFT_462795 [Daldinia caldariorum]|uniref:uncharacterized protein n=1 Tax=Daldinia caldariorum TaxID=326644 RepID=UPI002008773C|nr:uncharacterized protein F4812DRAFT_462795 [Daldinia caldariorum]KAI1464378.1 hypothetical protein F4812DRAFT_462795 [Daldinia caldariorum]